MKVVEASSSRLVLEDSPDVSLSRLGALGCALPLLLLGVAYARAVKVGAGVALSNALGACLTLAAAVYMLFRCRDAFHRGPATHRLTLGGSTVLEERFDTSGALKSSREIEAREVVATFQPLTGSGRPRGDGGFRIELRGEKGSAFRVDYLRGEKGPLSLLLKMQAALKRPVLIEGLKSEFRPALNVARTTSLAESYRIGEDGKTLEVDFSARERKNVGEVRRALITFSVLSFLYFCFGFWVQKGPTPLWWFPPEAAVVGFPLWLLRRSYTDKPDFCVLRLNDGRISLSAEGRTYEQPLSALRDILVLSRGLHFVFDDEVHGLLTNCPDQADLSYLYSVIAQTLKAQGHSMPAGLIEGSGNQPEAPPRS